MAPASMHSLGCSSFGLSVTRQPCPCSKVILPFSLCGHQLWAGFPVPQGWHSPAQEVAKPWAEKQQLQQRALFVKMEPVCASVPVSRLACPAALS